MVIPIIVGVLGTDPNNWGKKGLMNWILEEEFKPSRPQQC